MINACFFISGLVFGLGVYILLFMKASHRVDGVFIIDDSEDAELTRWTLQMKSDPYKISEKKMVHLKVKHIKRNE